MQHPFENYVNVPEVIGIRTNIRGFRWGFGACDSPAPENAFENCKIKVFLEEKHDRAVFENTDVSEYTETFRDFKANPGSGSVIYDKKIGPVRLRFSVSVQGNRLHVAVGRSYLRFVKIKFMYIHPIAYVLFDVVSMLLLHQDLTTLYCSAALLPNGSSVICVGPPNTGKSLTVLQLQNKFGARIIAEDMAVTNGESVYGAPHTDLYRNYHDGSLRTAVKEPEGDFFVRKIDAVFLLQKGTTDQDLQTDDFLRRILLINRYSLGYYYSPCVRVLDYYNSGFDTESAQRTERQILSRLVNGSRSFALERHNSLDFAPYIHELMNGESTRGDR